MLNQNPQARLKKTAGPTVKEGGLSGKIVSRRPDSAASAASTDQEVTPPPPPPPNPPLPPPPPPPPLATMDSATSSAMGDDTAGDDAGGGGDTQAQLMNAIKSGAGSLRRVEPSAEPKAFTPRTGRVL